MWRNGNKTETPNITLNSRRRCFSHLFPFHRTQPHFASSCLNLSICVNYASFRLNVFRLFYYYIFIVSIETRSPFRISCVGLDSFTWLMCYRLCVSVNANIPNLIKIQAYRHTRYKFNLIVRVLLLFLPLLMFCMAFVAVFCSADSDRGRRCVCGCMSTNVGTQRTFRN